MDCSPWGHEESDMTEQPNNNNNEIHVRMMAECALGFLPPVARGHFARSLINTAEMAEVGWGFLVPGSEIMEEGGYGPHRNSQNLPGTEGHSGSGLEAAVRNPLCPGVWTELHFSPKIPQPGQVVRISPGTLVSERNHQDPQTREEMYTQRQVYPGVTGL